MGAGHAPLIQEPVFLALPFPIKPGVLAGLVLLPAS